MNFSIVIPTYERPENLTLILERLAVSTSKRTHIIILTEPGSDSLPTKERMAEWSEKLNIELFINNCNVGVDESILRAYEACNSDWIYFMGDSKLPVDNFEEVIKSANTSCPMAAAYFFCHDSSFDDGMVISTIEDLVSSGLTLGDFILGGNSIFSREMVEKYIRYSYRTLSSRIAHVAMPIIALSKGEHIFISNKRVIEKFIEKPTTYQPGKALLDCWASFPLLVLLPLLRQEAFLLNKYIIKNESFNSRFVFMKYCLLKIFREKKQISKDLKVLLQTRYIFYSIFYEITIIRLIFIISLGVEGLKRRVNE